MSVEFNEEADIIARRPRPKKASLFTRLVIKLQLAQDEAGAQKVILNTAIGFFVLAALIFLNLIFGII